MSARQLAWADRAERNRKAMEAALAAESDPSVLLGVRKARQLETMDRVFKKLRARYSPRFPFGAELTVG